MEAMKGLIMVIFFFAFAYSAYAGDQTEAASYKDLFNIVWGALGVIVIAYMKSIKATFAKEIKDEKDAREKLEDLLLKKLESIDENITSMKEDEVKRLLETNKAIQEVLLTVQHIESKLEASGEKLKDVRKEVDENKKEISWIKQQLPKYKKAAS